MTFQLHLILKNLSEYFPSDLNISEIEPLFEKSKNYLLEDDDDEDEERVQDFEPTIEDIDAIIKAKKDNKCIEILSELISTAVQNRETPGIFFCQYDNWEFLGRHISIDKYLVFMHCLVRMCDFDCLDKQNRKLSVLAGRAYMILLTTPGAKPEKVFDENLIIHCINLFNCLKTIRKIKKNNERNDRIHEDDFVEFQMDLVNFLVELKAVFNHVLLDEYNDIIQIIFKTMTIIIRENQLNGYDSKYAYHMTIEAYAILEVICNATRENIDETLQIVLNVTCCLHLFTAPPKFISGVRLSDGAQPFNESITEFMVKLLHKQPTNVSKALENFIKAVISNRDPNLSDENYELFINASVLYDSTMYSKYSITVLPYLEKSILAQDAKIRINTITMLNKMVKSELPKEDSNFKRVMGILKLILHSIIDVDNNVKMIALSGFLNLFKEGNYIIKEIFKLAFEKSTELNLNPEDFDMPSCAADINCVGDENSYDVNQYEVTKIFPLKKVIELDGKKELDISCIEVEIKELLRNLLYLLNNNTFQIRTVALEILEYLLLKNRDCIDNKYFYDYVSSLTLDCSPKVRKQLIIFVNNVSDAYPDYLNINKLYAETILEFLKDRDKQICSMAIESIRSKIFNCIKTYELSSSPPYKRPWVFFSVIIANDYRNKFDSHMDLLIKNNVVNQKVLNVVETHLSTSNATEAWTVTYLLSKKVKSRDPEYVISAFKDVIINPEIVRSDVCDLVFQVMNTWIEDFELSTLQNIREMIRDLINSGSSESHLMSNLYNFANKAYSICNKGRGPDIVWISDIYNNAVSYILVNIIPFMEDIKMEDKLAQNLYLFSESSSDILRRPSNLVTDFLIEFLKKIEAGEIIIVPGQNTYEAKLCVTITVLTRLALRDSLLAHKIAGMFVNISDITKSSFNVSSNLSYAFRDLFIKFSMLMDCTIRALAKQILSEYTEIRFQALTYLAEIIMKDLTKLSSYLVFHVFLAIVDDDKKISKLAKNLILSYVEHRNMSLLRECFIDTIFMIHKYINFTQFTSIKSNEFRRNIKLYSWPDDSEKRYILYNFIVESLDPIEAYKLFEWISIIITELKTQQFKSNKNARAALRDIIYILRKLCLYLVLDEESKLFTKKNLKDEENDLTDDENDEEKTLLINAKPKDTVEPIISIVPTFYENIKTNFPEFVQKLDRLMEAICICFPDMITESTFWDPFLNSITKKTKASKENSGEKNEKIRLINYIMRKEKDPLEIYLYR